MKHVIIGVAVVGIVAAVAMQVQAQLRMREAEHMAATALTTIVEAQRTFRRSGGRGGYATDLQSLTQPCPNETTAAAQSRPPLALSVVEGFASYDYQVVVRAAQQASVAGTDCHGRPTASDFYASLQPVHAWAGRHALASTSRGRIYVFFDGLPPLERDMEAGALAVPLDTLDTFKIP